MKFGITSKLTKCLVILFVQSCDGQTKESVGKDVSRDQPVGIIRNISKDKRDNSFSKMKRNIEIKLGLSSIENGFNELQIRIWKGFVHTNYVQLSIFTKVDTIWSAQLYNLVLHYNKDFDSVVAVTKDIVTKQPRSGWKYFTDTLLKLEILDLPDESEISNYNTSMDSDAVTVEVSTTNKYRVYSYSDVESLSKTIVQAMKMAQILKLIQDEF